MIASDALYHRLIASDAASTAGRLGVIAARTGNPFRVAFYEAAGVHGFACPVIPTPSFNRVIGLSENTADLVPKLAAWFDGVGARGRVELLAGWVGPKLSRALGDHGWIHSGSSAVCAAAPVGRPAPPDVRVEAVANEAAMDLFLETHLAGWGIPQEHWRGAKENMRNWRELEGWAMLLARIDGQPAGTAVLCVQDGVAYCADAATKPQFRGRGAHGALLLQRLRLAQEAGCDLIWSNASFPSQSYRDLRRVGMSLVANVSVWERGK